MIDPNRLCLGCMNELEEENKICKICGWNSEADENSPHQLKCGTVLQGKYLVGKVLGEGGFGITYLGFNLLLQEKVAIKEFYPHGFVGRDTTVNSTVMSYVGQESFTEKSKDGFIREAKTMQSLNKVEGIVEMKDVFAENNTVYIVMEYVEGQTLKEYVKENGNKLPMSTVLELLEPVMDALEQIHAHNLIHRDISPDNIMVGPDGKVTLLDLGAARQISADGGHSLTVNVKHGYAPMEQYQTHGEQGPWTDIYALCATIYRLITGKVPPSATDRAFDDSMVKPMMLGAEITEEQEKILLKGLAPRSGDRYLNMFELRDAFKLTEKEDLIEEIIVPEEIVSTENENEVQKYINVKDEIKPKSKSNSEKIIKIAIAVATIFLIVGISFFSVDVIEKNKLEKEYNSALLLAENGKYEEAIAAFEVLGDYKDSEEQIVICEDAITDFSIKVGDYITFGSYEQDNNLENGKEPIEWQVLDVQNGKALVISKLGLDAKPFYPVSSSNDFGTKELKWEISTLKTWLNNVFIDNAFNDRERLLVADAIIDDNKTADRLFLLSETEVYKYFKEEDRICFATEYAIENGASVSDKHECCWWLRTTSNYYNYNDNYVKIIDNNGYVSEVGDFNRFDYVVRPAMWIDIENIEDDNADKDITTINVAVNDNVNIEIDTILGAKSFSKRGSVPEGTKLTGEWYLNDNNEYVFTMWIEGIVKSEGEYLFSVDYLDETGKVVETKKYLIKVKGVFD